MKTMHPLRITSVTEDSYHFSFATAGGIVGFIFPFEGSEANANPRCLIISDANYARETVDDPARMLIDQCAIAFDAARKSPVDGLYKPASLEYVGEGPDGYFNYVLRAIGPVSEVSLPISVFHDEEQCKYQVSSRLGSIGASLGSKSFMWLDDPSFQFADLYQAVVHFDTARDFRLDKSAPVYRVDLRLS